MSRRFKTRRIKSDKAYRIGELADAAEVSSATVRAWLRSGMGQMDDTRPTMIMGFQALAYLNERKRAAKRPMEPWELYCLRCKAPRRPLGGMTDYVATSAAGGRLKGLCGVCECPCNRNISAKELPALRKILDVKIRSVE